MFECFMLNARYVITVSLCWAVTVSPRAELGYHWCRHSENHPSLLPPSHMTTNTVPSSADTILSLPLIGQRVFQLSTEPETGWERWCYMLGGRSWPQYSGLWLLSRSHHFVLIGRYWAGLRQRPDLAWAEAEMVRLRGGEAAHHRSGCSECRVNIATHWHKPSFDMTSPMTVLSFLIQTFQYMNHSNVLKQSIC